MQIGMVVLALISCLVYVVETYVEDSERLATISSEWTFWVSFAFKSDNHQFVGIGIGFRIHLLGGLCTVYYRSIQ